MSLSHWEVGGDDIQELICLELRDLLRGDWAGVRATVSTPPHAVPQGGGAGVGAGKGCFGLLAFLLENRFLPCLRKPCSVTPNLRSRVGNGREVQPTDDPAF